MIRNKNAVPAGFVKSTAICLLLLLSFSGIAQVATSRLGVRAGINRMDVHFDPEPAGKSKTVPGYEAALVFQHIAEPHFGIQLEAAVRQLKWRHDQDTVRSFTLEQYDAEFTAATYVYFGELQNSLFIHLGPTIGCTVNAKDEASQRESSYVHLLGNQTRNYLFYGLTAGAGFTKRIGPTTWQLEGRFSQKLVNLFRTGGGSDLNFARILPNAFSMSLTYFIYHRNQ